MENGHERITILFLLGIKCGDEVGAWHRPYGVKPPTQILPQSCVGIDEPFLRVYNAKMRSSGSTQSLWWVMVMHFLWFAVFGLFFLLFHLPFLWSSQPLPSTSKDETPLATCVHQHFQSFTCVVGSTGDLHNLGMAKENAKHTTVVGDRHHSKGSYNSYRYTNKFKTSGKLPIFLEYSMRHTSNQQKKKNPKDHNI